MALSFTNVMSSEQIESLHKTFEVQERLVNRNQQVSKQHNEFQDIFQVSDFFNLYHRRDKSLYLSQMSGITISLLRITHE